MGLLESRHLERNALCRLIAEEFATNHSNSCLGEAYLLREFIETKKLHDPGSPPRIVKGFVEDDQYRLHWVHFWVSCEGANYDPGTVTYWLQFPREFLSGKPRATRRINETLTRGFTLSVGSVSPSYQEAAYRHALSGTMWQHLTEEEHAAMTRVYQSLLRRIL